MEYLLLKLIQIISATIMFGTGLGSAFYLYFIYKRSSQTKIIKEVLKLVIVADYIFTTPSVAIQLITGIWLSYIMGILSSKWFVVVIISSIIIFGLWVRAVYLQINMKKQLENQDEITPQFHKMMKEWFFLGVPAFLGSIFLFYLMVYKPFF